MSDTTNTPETNNARRVCLDKHLPKYVVSANLAEKLERERDELREVAAALREWIDAIPKETALPAMPGVDRDWVDSVIGRK